MDKAMLYVIQSIALSLLTLWVTVHRVDLCLFLKSLVIFWVVKRLHLSILFQLPWLACHLCLIVPKGLSA